MSASQPAPFYSNWIPSIFDLAWNLHSLVFLEMKWNGPREKEEELFSKLLFPRAFRPLPEPTKRQMQMTLQPSQPFKGYSPKRGASQVELPAKTHKFASASSKPENWQPRLEWIVSVGVESNQIESNVFCLKFARKFFPVSAASGCSA